MQSDLTPRSQYLIYNIKLRKPYTSLHLRRRNQEIFDTFYLMNDLNSIQNWSQCSVDQSTVRGLKPFGCISFLGDKFELLADFEEAAG